MVRMGGCQANCNQRARKRMTEMRGTHCGGASISRKGSAAHP
jgi:hypothetical protein